MSITSPTPSRAEPGRPANLTALDEGFVFGGGMTVGGTHTVAGVGKRIAELLKQNIPSRLSSGDATLWGPAAQAEAEIRLGWLQLPDTSRKLASDLVSVREELRAEGLDRVVLGGMGGSSLAPEVIARTLGLDLTVLDTTDPGQVREALGDRLERSVIVVSSKSGGTVETDSHRRACWQAFADTGMSEEQIARRFIIVTDPGSPLETIGKQLKVREIFLANADVGGRYSALTAFGLVPAALAGADVMVLLDEAARLATTLVSDGPALRLGVAMGMAAIAGRDKLVLAEDGTGLVGLGDWVEQLVAESTGKNGTGILPIVVEQPDAPGSHGSDVVLTTIGGAISLGDSGRVPGVSAEPDLTVNGPLGAQFLAWEYATAVAGMLLEINPFDQPNVAESKQNTAKILDGEEPPAQKPFARTANIELYGDAALFEGVRSPGGAVASLIGAIGKGGYLAIMAYLDRIHDAAAGELRSLLARRTDRPVTFGWGPRFLHSTGQYHKGGPANGAFLQITGAVNNDLDVTGKAYSFGRLQAAQAAGDRQALSGRGRPLLRVHLVDRERGIDELLEALR
ncbi:MAG: hypothetical protein ACRDQZ_20210 [Mycobacteriales bacterium]